MRKLEFWRQLSDLDSIVTNANLWSETARVSEEAYLGAIRQLRNAFPIEELPDDLKSELLGPINEIEQLFFDSPRQFGKRLISKAKFKELTAKFREKLRIASIQIEDIINGRPVTPIPSAHAKMSALAPLEAELKAIAQKFGDLLGKNRVNEAALFDITRQLRQIISSLSLSDEDRKEWLSPLNEMEKLVSTSRIFMGNRLVPERKLSDLFSDYQFASMRFGWTAVSIEIQNSLRKLDYDALLKENPDVLDAIERGESFAVVREGRIVARLFPPQC